MLVQWFLRISDATTAGEVEWRDRYWAPKLSRNLPSPNALTLIRLIGSVTLVALSPKLTATIGAAVPLAVTDYFDGIIARTQGRETTLGKWLDPVADKILIAAVLLAAYRSDYELWAPLIVGMVIPELALGFIGLALRALRVPLTPRPCLWGRLKFTVYIVAIGLYLLGSPPTLLSLLVKCGIALAYTSLLYYLLRGYSERRALVDG